MNVRIKSTAGCFAFSIMEVLVAMTITCIVLLAFYAGLSQSFSTMSAARENLRATQIMVEKLEAIRLYNWDQLNKSGFLPTTFTDTYYPTTNSSTSGGAIYSGQVIITNCPVGTSYATNMKMITIRVTWNSGQITRNREMTTYVSQNGLQKYLYYAY